MSFGLHPVGDHYTESDFYGGYAAGARAILAGSFDPARYGIVGPLYECLLALGGALGLELFTAARLLSLAAACAALAFLSALVARHWGPQAGAWSALLAGLSPTFTRYAWSATTEMPAVALQIASLAALLAGRAPRPLTAGLLGALATLTRFSSLHLLAAGVAVLLLRPCGGARRGPLVRFGLGFGVPLAAWSALSLASGVAPARHLFSHYAFYTTDDASRNWQDAPRAADAAPARTLDPAGPAPPLPPLAEIARQWSSRLPAHAAEDARALLGWPLAALVAAGAIAGLRGARRREMSALLAPAATTMLALAASFYSARYRILLAPLAAAVAASLAASGAGAPWRRRAVHVALAATALHLAVTSFEHQRIALSQLPFDVLRVGAALREAEPRGAPVMSRKGHIGYYSGRPVQAFPRVLDLPELARAAREGGAGFLYVSWYEAQLRPEFTCLLDTSSHIPGLTPVAVSLRPPAVAYRIGPGFGAAPPWWNDAAAHRLHQARARLLYADDSSAAIEHTVVAVHAMAEDRVAEAHRHASAALRTRPDLGLAWAALGWSHERMGHEREAVVAFEKARVLDPGSAVAEDGLRLIAARIARRDSALAPR